MGQKQKIMVKKLTKDMWTTQARGIHIWCKTTSIWRYMTWCVYVGAQTNTNSVTFQVRRQEYIKKYIGYRLMKSANSYVISWFISCHGQRRKTTKVLTLIMIMNWKYILKERKWHYFRNHMNIKGTNMSPGLIKISTFWDTNGFQA